MKNPELRLPPVSTRTLDEWQKELDRYQKNAKRCGFHPYLLPKFEVIKYFLEVNGHLDGNEVN